MKKFSEALAQFRDGLIPEMELEKRLEGNLLIREGDSGEIHIQHNANLTDLCEIRASHLCEFLKKYMAGKISADSLSRWTNIMLFLMMGGIYEVSKEATEKEEDAIIDALHELGSPEINGDITIEKATNLLNSLKVFSVNYSHNSRQTNSIV